MLSISEISKIHVAKELFDAQFNFSLGTPQYLATANSLSGRFGLESAASAILHDHLECVNERKRLENAMLGDTAGQIHRQLLEMGQGLDSVTTFLRHQNAVGIGYGMQERNYLAQQSFLESLNITASFRAPFHDEITGAARLYAEPYCGKAQSIASMIAWQNVLQAQYESLALGWVDAHNPASSFAGFAKLGGLNQIIRERAFESETLYAMREAIGETYSTGHRILENIVGVAERVRAYRTLGFDSDLTHFRSDSYLQILARAGFEVLWTPEDDESDDTERPHAEHHEELLVLSLPSKVNTRIYEILFAFESAIRNFISHELRRRHGDDWHQIALPPSLITQYRKKQNTDVSKGRPTEPLIAYADISHYAQIMQHNNNWEHSFESYFKDLGALNSAFAWIAGIRNVNHHNRQLAKEDVTLFVMNMQHILQAIGVPQSELAALKLDKLQSVIATNS